MHDPRFSDVLDELRTLRDNKGVDYDNEVPYSNLRGIEKLGIPSWVATVTRMGDKLRRLESFYRNGYLANEGAEDAFMDLAVYAVIGLILFREVTTPAAGNECGLNFLCKNGKGFICTDARGHGGGCSRGKVIEDMELSSTKIMTIPEVT